MTGYRLLTPDEIARLKSQMCTASDWTTIEVAEDFNPENIRGTFVKGTKHLRRRKESGRKPMKAGVALIIIGILLFIWHYLQTGSFRF